MLIFCLFNCSCFNSVYGRDEAIFSSIHSLSSSTRFLSESRNTKLVSIHAGKNRINKPIIREEVIFSKKVQKQNRSNISGMRRINKLKKKKKKLMKKYQPVKEKFSDCL